MSGVLKSLKIRAQEVFSLNLCVQEICENGDLLHHLRKFPFLKIPHDVKREEEANVPRYVLCTKYTIIG
jgi:hypothetical protein